MRILIVDDELAAGTYLQSLIEQVPGVSTDIATSGEEALKKASVNQPQAVFLDIDMPDINGLELARTLAKENEDLSFVFATAYPDYALEAFELYSVDYILKPFDKERIKKTVKKLLDKSRYSDEVPVLIKTVKQNVFLKPCNILYIEAQPSGNIIQTLNGIHITKENINDLHSKLPQYYFFRCHRSYVVNLKRIKEIVPSGRTFQIVLETSEKIPLSRNQEKTFRMKLQK